MQNIFVAVLAVLTLGAGIFGWWVENGNTKKSPEAKKSDPERRA